MKSNGSRKKSWKWDDRYLGLAQHVSKWSKDPKAQVGAVLIDAQGRLCAVGYNGFPRAVEDSAERLTNKQVKLDMIIHAEANAITIAGRSAVGGEIYVFGKPVCAQCAGQIIQSGIKRVIAEKPTKGTTSHWDQVGLLAEEILRETSEIDVDLIPRDELLARMLPKPLKKARKSPTTAPLFERNIGLDGSRPDTRSQYHLIKDTGSAVSRADEAGTRSGDHGSSPVRRAGRSRRTR